MKRRKPNNPRARLERSCRAILSSNHVAVVSISPSGWQGMVNWKLAKRIPPGRQVANALCDIPHRWTIYVAGLRCISPKPETNLAGLPCPMPPARPDNDYPTPVR